MSDWHFGGDYDMWLYPPVDWTPDCDYELPEPIEAANIEGTLLINAKDAIEQMRRLQAENAKLREEVEQWHRLTAGIELPEYPITQFQPKDLERENAKLRELVRDWRELAVVGANSSTDWNRAQADLEDRMRELGVEVDW